MAMVSISSRFATNCHYRHVGNLIIEFSASPNCYSVPRSPRRYIRQHINPDRHHLHSSHRFLRRVTLGPASLCDIVSRRPFFLFSSFHSNYCLPTFYIALETVGALEVASCPPFSCSGLDADFTHLQVRPAQPAGQFLGDRRSKLARRGATHPGKILATPIGRKGAPYIVNDEVGRPPVLQLSTQALFTIWSAVCYLHSAAIRLVGGKGG